MATVLSKASSKAKKEQPEEEEKPKAPEAQPQTERYEKHEKGEKQEKHEKQAPEKHEKHEKRGMGVTGAIIAGTLLIILGVIILLQIWYPSVPWWPILLILAGIAIIVYGIMATSAMRKSPRPPS
jgi:F0F1-type ATP synthase assembly protein I